MVNQNPEQIARDKIDDMLKAAGWVVQSLSSKSKAKINFNEGEGLSIREYQTDVDPADYVLFIDKKAVGVIEAKREESAQNITAVETQTEGYEKAESEAAAKAVKSAAKKTVKPR